MCGKKQKKVVTWYRSAYVMSGYLDLMGSEGKRILSSLSLNIVAEHRNSTQTKTVTQKNIFKVSHPGCQEQPSFLHSLHG